VQRRCSGGVKRTFGVDGRLDLLEPARLDVVSELLHRRLDVSDLDSVLALLIKRAERSARSCQQINNDRSNLPIGGIVRLHSPGGSSNMQLRVLAGGFDPPKFLLPWGSGTPI